MQQLVVSDQELVRQYLDGKSSAFEILLERHKERIYTHIFLMIKDKSLAEDIFQETFIKVINTLRKGKYNEEGKFLPWVMRIAHNLVIDHFRRRKKMPMVRSDENYDVFATIKRDEPNVEQDLINGQIDSDVKKLLKHLPQEQREVVIMRHYLKLSFKEISEKTNVSINTALGRMRYALINLRKLINENQIELNKVN